MKKLRVLILFCLFIFIFCAAPVSAKEKRKPVDLEIPSYDGFKITATLDVPDYASVKNKAPLVIFLHSICKSRIAWDNFPLEVKNSLNVATLNIDLRGHGNSIVTKKNKKLYWQYMKKADYQKMPEDINEVLNYIEKQYPEIDTTKIAIVGSSLGASVGLMAANYQKKDIIKTVIMLSPMLEYKGFDLRLPIVDYGNHPLLFIVSEKDKYSYNSSRELIKFAQDKKLLKVYPYGGNGEDLLKFQPESKEIIIKWLEDNLTQGKIIIKNDEEEQKPRVKYKEINSYSGKIKESGDIYGGIH